MRYITLTIQAEDFPFVIEAIRLRASTLLEGIAMQVESQQRPVQKPEAAPKAPNAPWGVKKDGTPKKRPGRAKRVAK